MRPVLFALWIALKIVSSTAQAAEARDVATGGFMVSMELAGAGPEYSSGGYMAMLDTKAPDRHAMRDWMMNRSMANRLRQQYEDMTREYDRRALFSQVSPYEELSHLKRVSDFSRNVVSEVKNYHIGISMEEMKNRALLDPDMKRLAGPAVTLAAGYTYATGRPVNLIRAEHATVNASTHVMHREASLGFSSPYLISTSVQYAHASHDRYRLVAMRAVPFVDAHGAVSYGARSRSVTAALSKSFTEHISGQIDSTRVIGQAQTQETVRLNYSIAF